MKAEPTKTSPIDQRAFGARITTAMAEGQAGRREIASQLARLPLEQLVKVPPSSFAMLGPEGFEMLVSMRRDIPAGVTARTSATAPSTPPKPVEAPRKVRRRWPIWVVCVALLAAGPVFDRSWPLVERMTGNSMRPIQVSAWPVCRRLDAYVDGCLYRTGSPQTTLRQLAGRLHMPAGDLVRPNRHLTTAPDEPLSRGTLVVVWRGVAKLYR
ncbi:hypothetical protein [Shinella zoogloeoides]|uniref:hypothetical protein n=1 Tax=Shinella zoogloeoides TaxID=352475 RepID=UPI001F57A912|nr:hypothetical protein [Shinella zoogloeoides]